MLEKQFGLLKGVGGIVYEKHLNHTQCLPPSLFSSEPGVQGQSLYRIHHAFASVSLPLWCVEALAVLPNSLGSFFFCKFLAMPACGTLVPLPGIKVTPCIGKVKT